MPKKILSLDEAKELLKTEKVFDTGRGTFNVVDVFGRYSSGFTIEIPKEWYIGENNQPESPIRYIQAPELTRYMNDFNGYNVEVLFGEFSISKAGRPVFKITKPTEATQVLVKVAWGGQGGPNTERVGSAHRTRGVQEWDAEKDGPTYFRKRNSRGQGEGIDYWVLPVGFVRGKEPRDVSDIIAKIQTNEDDRLAQIEQDLEEQERLRQESINNRERILSEISPIVEKIKLYYPNFEFEAGPEEIVFKNGPYVPSQKRYTNALVEVLNQVLANEISKKAARDEYKPRYEEYKKSEDIFHREQGLTLAYEEIGVILRGLTPIAKTYPYSSDGYTLFVDDIIKYKEKIKKEQEDARIKQEQLEREEELTRLKADAKAKGYPEEFTFWDRVGGATNLSHAYVVERDGTIRQPDYSERRNSNKRCQGDSYADGTRIYDQILPGQVIVSYTKLMSGTPFVLNVEWADREASQEQLSIICQLLNDLEATSRGIGTPTSYKVDIDGNIITSIKEWVTYAIRLKSKECRIELGLGEAPKNDDFATDILGYGKARSELSALDKNSRVLLEELLKQLTNKGPYIGDGN